MQICQNTIRLIEVMNIYDKARGCYIKFNLWKKQKELLIKIHTCRFIIILKKRQAGISQLVGADSLCQCMALTNFTVLILSKSGDDAKEFLIRVKDMYDSLDQHIKDVNPIIKNTQDEMSFSNGARIKSLPANKGAGMTADRVVIDEAGFITLRDSHIELDNVLRRVQPTVEKAKGQLIILSTANGMNRFAKMYKKAKNKLSNYYAFFFSCHDDPTFSHEDRLNIIKDYGEDHANQEYPRTDQEAFLSSGRPRFDQTALKWYEENTIKEYLSAEILEDGIIESSNGRFNVYKKRIPGSYAIIADVAEGLEKNDYSVFKVVNMHDKQIYADWRGHVEPSAFGDIITWTARVYYNALIIVEANNHGHAVLVQIKNTNKYPESLIFEHDILGRETLDDAYDNPVARYGWRTTTSSRPLIINNLGKMILERSMPRVSEGDIEELQSFIINKNGKAEADTSCYDDRVMALAMFNYLLNLDEFFIHYPQFIPKENQKCSKCDYLKGIICTESQRTCDPGDSCRLFNRTEWSPDSSDYNRVIRLTKK
jgi:hypothetical protein